MAEKLRAFAKLVLHTMLSLIATLLAGSAVYSTLRPILGRERYHQFAQSPLIMVLLLAGVAFGAMQVYRRWPDRLAFFAWVFPAILTCHLLLYRGMAEMKGQWSDSLFWLGIGSAYSVGALITAIVTGYRSENTNVRGELQQAAINPDITNEVEGVNE
ncbi:MAG TPA: hypothetical protein VFA90_05055 [Terriglobales bacterium]|nr:hypothetical protein [Terriglobales bacterium]